MKIESFIFLIFITASAIVIGTTLGLISNIQYLTLEAGIINSGQISSDEVTLEASAKEDELSDTDNKNEIDTDNEEESNIYEKSEIGPSDKISVSIRRLEFSPKEEQQIEILMNELGKQEEESKQSFVARFQEEHGLNITQIVDSQTLSAMIYQVTLIRINN